MSAQSSDSHELVFYGTDGIEAEEFIRSVRKVAKSAGKMRDNSWILDDVYTAFAGDTLRWYIELDDETRSDWLLLQRAIMEKYPSPSQRSLSDNQALAINQSSTVPIPAAAIPPPPFAPLTSDEEKYFFINMMTGDCDQGLCIGSIDGCLGTVPFRSKEALTVRYDRPTKELRLIQMPNKNDTGQKFAIQYEKRWWFKVPGGLTRYAGLVLLDSQGLPSSGTTIYSDWECLTSWNVIDEGILQAVSKDDPGSSATLLWDGCGKPDKYQFITVRINHPSLGGAPFSRFFILQLEEIC